MIRSRGTSALLLLAFLSANAPAAAPKRIVVLRSGDLPLYEQAVSGFSEALKRDGFAFSLENHVLTDAAAAEGLMADVRANPPDLIFTVGTFATRVAQEKAGGVPFTYSMVVDPPSLGVKGGGAVMETRPSFQFAFLRENFPGMKRIGVIHSSQRNQEAVRLLQKEVPADYKLVLAVADTPEEMSNAIGRLAREADCLLMVSDAVLYSPQTATRIILQTIQSGLPMIAVSPSFVRAGALAAVYPEFRDNGVLAAKAASRFFNGEAMEAIPVQWPLNMQTAVNLIVAERLGVKVQEKTLHAAAEVVR